MLAAKAAVDCLIDRSLDKKAIWAINTEEDYHEEHSSSSVDAADSEPGPGRAAA